MRRNEPSRSELRNPRSLITPLLCLFLGREVLKVEDGQFEREYSRLYTTIVVGVALLILLVVGALLVSGMRALLSGD
ncbi:MAG: hypothetical protein M3220_02210 [Chloroflexota bacterium]|nr:hypothetical protein [Chloroflexota bacterium]